MSSHLTITPRTKVLRPNNEKYPRHCGHLYLSLAETVVDSNRYHWGSLFVSPGTSDLRPISRTVSEDMARALWVNCPEAQASIDKVYPRR